MLISDPDNGTIEGILATAMERTEHLVKNFSETATTKQVSPEEILILFQRIEEIFLSFEPVWIYSYLAYSADQEDEKALALYREFEKFQSEQVKLFNPLFAELAEIVREHRSALVSSPLLEPYRWYLDRLVRDPLYEHYASEEKEQAVFNSALLQDKLLAARRYRVTIDGKEMELSWKDARHLLINSSRHGRRTAIKQVLGRLLEEEETFADCLRGICSSYVDMYRRKGHPSALHLQVIRDGVAVETVENMVAAVEQRIPLFKRFLRLKARMFGDDVLHGEDYRAVIPAEKAGTRIIPWEEAEELVVSTYRSIDPDLGSRAEQVFSNRQIDARPGRGKKDRKFTMGWHGGKTAFVMLTYDGSFDNVLTLVHELGHCLHDSCQFEQPYIVGEASDNVGEAFAEFGTLVLLDRLLKGTGSREEKLVFYFKILEKLMLFIYDFGIMRYRFEESLYRKIEKGEHLDAKKITDLYAEQVERFTGGAVDFLPEQYRLWACNPLFYSVFRRYYNYPYAFSALVMLVLQAEYRKKGKEFVRVYREMLAAGGSKDPQETLELAGLDLLAVDFWERAFSELERLVDDLEALVERGEK